ncbi:maleylpyruvate isomerase family mycothiol-dependent enzyme [Pseudonocardia lacus]|uniref:maleylpyruvate isomerase family mycothiol-dependent enzyme n=1 Tax=Pseudonocardia lacus TaxID=2835865 RepID=UPI001BDCDB34|nr:maleylpyruvate isomerase family mycothiol-dependent enzyme [Pseudonocardia lacus]
MLLTPRYDGVPVLRIQGATGDPSIPLLRQRRRLAEVLAALDPDQWSIPTRCARWSVRDVVVHLVGINELWQASIAGARAGEPTRLFRSFDPVVTPALLVEAVPGWTPSHALARFVETTDALAAAVAGLDDEGWSLIGESPLGHVELRLVATHALWDGWIHEGTCSCPSAWRRPRSPTRCSPASGTLRHSVRPSSLRVARLGAGRSALMRPTRRRGWSSRWVRRSQSCPTHDAPMWHVSLDELPTSSMVCPSARPSRQRSSVGWLRMTAGC